MQHQKRPQTQPSTERETSFEHEMSLHSSYALIHITTLEVGGITPLSRWENWGQHGWVPCPESYSLEVAAPDLNRDLSIPNPMFFSLHLQLHCTVKGFKGWGGREPSKWREGTEPPGPGREQGRQGLFHREVSQLMLTLTWNPPKSPCNRSVTHNKCVENVVQTHMPT